MFRRYRIPIGQQNKLLGWTEEKIKAYFIENLTEGDQVIAVTIFKEDDAEVGPQSMFDKTVYAVANVECITEKDYDSGLFEQYIHLSSEVGEWSKGWCFQIDGKAAAGTKYVGGIPFKDTSDAHLIPYNNSFDKLSSKEVLSDEQILKIIDPSGNTRVNYGSYGRGIEASMFLLALFFIALAYNIAKIY